MRNRISKHSMMRSSLVLTIGIIAFSLTEQVQAEIKTGDRVPGVLIVKFRSDVTPAPAQRTVDPAKMGLPSVDAVNARFGLKSYRGMFPGVRTPQPPRRMPDLTRFHRLRFPHDVDLDSAAAAYRMNPQVEAVEFDAFALIEAVPNDSIFGQMWNLSQPSNHDINADLAWDLTTGSPDIVLGVTDTGVLWEHEDLRDNIWVNPGEDLDGDGEVYDPDDMNGIDDDGNGYVDDLIGWDFVSDGPSFGYPTWPGEDAIDADNDPKDFHGHGTHVSGTIAGVTNNVRGVSGIAGGFGPGNPGCKIMCLRMGWSIESGGNEYGVTVMSYVAEAFVYGADMGARAINYSYGSSTGGGIEAATDYAVAKGVIICAAAGNSSSSQLDYLQSRGDVITVAATDENDLPAYFTSFGPLVDIAAPGTGVWSTFSNHYVPGYRASSGTSMASPHVTGLVGLMLSLAPGLDFESTLEILKSTALPIPAEPVDVGAGRIDAFSAVLMLGDMAIWHTPLGSTKNTSTPYGVSAAITADTTLNPDSLALYYRSSPNPDTNFIRVPLLPTGAPGEYQAEIPAQPLYSVVEYGLVAADAAGNTSASPTLFPAEVHTFRILGDPSPVVDPDSLFLELPGGHSVPESLTVRNDGTDTLVAELSVRIDVPFDPAMAESRTGRELSLTWGETVDRPVVVTAQTATSMEEWPRLHADPVGDDLREDFECDLLEVRGRLTDTTLDLQLIFSGQTTLSAATAIIAFDTDQDPSTGFAPTFGLPTQTVGLEYYGWIFPPYEDGTFGYFLLFDTLKNMLLIPPITVIDSSEAFSIPLNVLGDPLGDVNLSMAVGGYYLGTTDYAPDSGHLVASWRKPLLTLQQDSLRIPPGDSASALLYIDAHSYYKDSTILSTVQLTASDSAGTVLDIPAVVHVTPPDYYVTVSPRRVSDDAASGDTLWYSTVLANVGVYADFYHLQASANGWDASAWDSAGTAITGVTPTLQPGDEYKVQCRLIVSGMTAYGDVDTLKLVVQSDADTSVTQLFRATVSSEGPAVTIPWGDEFDSLVLDPGKWQFIDGATVSDLGLEEPSAPYSLLVSGKSLRVGRVTSVPINLEGQTQVALSYWYQRTGGGVSTVPSADLKIEYYSESSGWVELVRHPGSGSDMAVYDSVDVLLPSDAFHSTFRLRAGTNFYPFRGVGDWFVDNIRLYVPSSPTISHAPDSFAFDLAAGDSSSSVLAIWNDGAGALRIRAIVRDSDPPLAGTVFPKIVPNTDDGMFALRRGERLSDNAPRDLVLADQGATPGLVEDFEDGDYAGWASYNEYYAREVTTEVAANGSLHSFKLDGPSWNNGDFDGVSRRFSAGRYEHAGFYVRMDSAGNHNGTVIIGSDDFPYMQACIVFRPWSDGRFNIYPDDHSFVYEGDRWYHVEFYLDWTNNTFDYYVDGDLIAADLRFAESPDNIGIIHLSNWDPSIAWWDEIVIGDEPLSGQWLSCWPRMDTLAPGETTYVALSVSTATVDPGEYARRIEILSNDPAAPTINVPVTLTVHGSQLAVRPGSILDSLQEDETITRTVWAANDGDLPLAVHSAASVGSWLTAQVPSGIVSPGDSVAVSVTIDATALLPGDYTSAVIVSSDDHNDTTSLVAVTVHIGPDPEIQVTPDSLAMTLESGTSATATLTVGNAGTGTLGFEAEVHYRFAPLEPGVMTIPAIADPVPLDPPTSYGLTQLPKQNTGTMAASSLSIILTPAVCAGIAFGPEGDLYAAAFFDDEILRRLADGTWVTYSTAVTSPYGIAFSADGDLAVAQGDSEDIVLVHPDGTSSLLATTGGRTPLGLAYGLDGNLYVTVEDGGLILRIAPDGTSSAFFAPSTNFAAAIGPHDGRLYVTSWDLGTVDIYEPDGSRSVLYGTIPTAEGVVFDVLGNLYYGNGTEGYITRITHDSTVEVIGTGYSGPLHLALDPTGLLHISTLANQKIDTLRVGIPGVPLPIGGQDWLMLGTADSAANGGQVVDTLEAQSNQVLNVGFSAHGMRGGDYYAEVVFASNDPVNSPLAMPIHLRVRSPEIAGIPESYSVGATEGATCDTTVWIANDGDLVLDVQLTSVNYWLEAVPSVLTINTLDSASVVLRIHADSLLPGEHSSSLVILSNDHKRPNLTASVSVRVGPDPDIAIAPEDLSIVLNHGESGADSVVISNLGAGTLQYAASVRYPDAAPSPQGWPHGRVKAQGLTKLNARDHRVSAAGTQGLLDYPEYRWIDSDSAGGPVFQWNDISEAGTVITPSYVSHTGPFPIGFDFPFYDSVYSVFYLSKHGYIGFGNPESYSLGDNTQIPDSTFPNNIIAWYWESVGPYPLGDDRTALHYLIEGNRLTVQFARLRHLCCLPGPWITGQIILSSDGSILLQTLEVQPEFSIGSATVGIENATGTGGLQVSFNDYYVHDSLAILIFRAPQWISVPTESALISGGGEEALEFQISTAGLAGSDYYAEVVFTSNDPDEDSVVVPVHLHLEGGALCDCQQHGDVGGHNGVLDAVDLSYMIDYVFFGKSRPTIDFHCSHVDRGDVNCDGFDDAVDISYLIDAIFLGGEMPCDPCACNPYPDNCP